MSKAGCDLKCTIARIRIDGKIHPFGGACDRYYNIRNESSEGNRSTSVKDADLRIALRNDRGREDKEGSEPRLNYVALRNSLMFDRYATVRKDKAARTDERTLGAHRLGTDGGTGRD